VDPQSQLANLNIANYYALPTIFPIVHRQFPRRALSGRADFYDSQAVVITSNFCS